jgi:hypothetical protein
MDFQGFPAGNGIFSDLFSRFRPVLKGGMIVLGRVEMV